MKKVHLLASESHFLEHLLPLWRAVPAEHRGGVFAGDDLATRRKVAHQAAGQVELERKPYPPPDDDGLTVVASVGDLARLIRWRPKARTGFTEHGCGITYKGSPNSFIGAKQRPNVEVLLVPSEELAERQRQATPDIHVTALGDEPKLDKFRGDSTIHLASSRRTTSDRPCICLAWHWDSRALPETRSALYWYRPHLAHFVATHPEWHVIGHAHPRMAAAFFEVCRHTGITYVASLDDVMRTADVFAQDNSSALYEVASIGTPVVVLNCPRYRRHIEHGYVRFWQSIPGPQVNDPHQLGPAITEALADAAPWPQERLAAVDRVFPNRDGQASARGAQALIEYL